MQDTTVTSTEPHSHPPTPAANSVHTAKRKASDTALPMKHLFADAIGLLYFEAMSKLKNQQESLAKMASTAQTYEEKYVSYRGLNTYDTSRRIST